MGCKATFFKKTQPFMDFCIPTRASDPLFNRLSSFSLLSLPSPIKQTLIHDNQTPSLRFLLSCKNPLKGGLMLLPLFATNFDVPPSSFVSSPPSRAKTTKVRFVAFLLCSSPRLLFISLVVRSLIATSDI